MSSAAGEHNGYDHHLGVPSITDDAVATANPEQIAELPGEEPAHLGLLHQASARLDNLAAYPHSRPARAVLDVAAEHIRSAEKVLRELDDVLGSKRSPARHGLSTRHLQQRVEREQQTLKLVLRQAG